MLKPLELVNLREGEEIRIKIERSVRERLSDLIGILGESSQEELERYLAEVMATIILLDTNILYQSVKTFCSERSPRPSTISYSVPSDHASITLWSNSFVPYL